MYSKRERVYHLMDKLRVFDGDTFEHSERVASYSRELGKHIGLERESLEELYLGALLHDIGKVRIPPEIIKKEGGLTNEEYELIKRHCEEGYVILKESGFEESISEVALGHHERVDGSGYPHGKLDRQLTLYSKIVGIADSFDAMTSDRRYKRKMSKEVALNELKKQAGDKYDLKMMINFAETQT